MAFIGVSRLCGKLLTKVGQLTEAAPQTPVSSCSMNAMHWTCSHLLPTPTRIKKTSRTPSIIYPGILPTDILDGSFALDDVALEVMGRIQPAFRKLPEFLNRVDEERRLGLPQQNGQIIDLQLRLQARL